MARAPCLRRTLAPPGYTRQRRDLSIRVRPFAVVQFETSLLVMYDRARLADSPQQIWTQSCLGQAMILITTSESRVDWRRDAHAPLSRMSRDDRSLSPAPVRPRSPCSPCSVLSTSRATGKPLCQRHLRPPSCPCSQRSPGWQAYLHSERCSDPQLISACNTRTLVPHFLIANWARPSVL